MDRDREACASVKVEKVSNSRRERIGQIGRFVLAGALNTAFGMTVYSLCVISGMTLLLALIAANVLGVAFSYATYGGYAFRQMSWTTFVRFVLAYGMLVASNWLLLLGLMSSRGLDAISAQLVLTIPMAFAGFLALKLWVFRSAMLASRDA